jgi:hypothetical protein
MPIPNIEHLANFPDYTHQPRVSVPGGLVGHEDITIKFYSMWKKELERYSPGKVFSAKEATHLMTLHEDPLSGMGFAILSTDMLNIAIWDRKTPFLLKNRLYCFDPEKSEVIETIKRLNTDEEGPFCAFELGIVNHERKQWLKYLQSRRTTEDKNRYLTSFLKGDL